MKSTLRTNAALVLAAGFLLLPLLIAILGSDIVSAESAEGTDKLLLTRPVRRWKVLASKLVTLWIFATLTLLCGALLAYAISAPVLPRGGWGAPTFTGFQIALLPKESPPHGPRTLLNLGQSAARRKDTQWRKTQSSHWRSAPLTASASNSFAARIG